MLFFWYHVHTRQGGTAWTSISDSFLFLTTTVNPQTKGEAIELATGIVNSITSDSPGEVGLFVPFPFIETVQEIAGDKCVVGAEV